MSEAGVSYRVAMYGDEFPAWCSCPAFLRDPRKGCKHIRALWEGRACLYNAQWHEGVTDPELRPISYTTADIDAAEPCPYCGGPTVMVRRMI